MIPRANITAWRKAAPWPDNTQVEQDLVLSRALVELFRRPAFAEGAVFRGGTALHKLFFDPPGRYSEDIDLVQRTAGPIGPLVNEIRAALDPWLGKPKRKAGQGRFALYYRFETTFDEDEAALVRAFFERSAAGESGAAIGAWTNAAGHRTMVHGGKGGAKWTGRSVLQVVRNPIFLGRRTHGEGTVEGVHDAIVDEDLARCAFAALDARYSLLLGVYGCVLRRSLSAVTSSSFRTLVVCSKVAFFAACSHA